MPDRNAPLREIMDLLNPARLFPGMLLEALLARLEVRG